VLASAFCSVLTGLRRFVSCSFSRVRTPRVGDCTATPASSC
jgi:hypothetical protein